jgi:hypothetical protein
MDMRADDTINTLIKQFAVKGGASFLERNENTIYQGVIIAFRVEADAYTDEGEFSCSCNGYVLATARGGNYIKVFGADDRINRFFNPISIPPESWKLLANHDTGWIDGIRNLLRSLQTALKEECPANLKDKIRFNASLHNSHPITMVSVKMPNREDIGKILPA